ncbi:MAG: hypothetical protein IJW40_03125 [Clostridia bacterium]|nr:hypothetical protein [Clostridia bacterium]
MKQYLIPSTGQFYKANMHTHSTVSDGHLTPQEVKELYKTNGYSVVAFTDHNIIKPHSDLNDEDFLTITGVELNTEYLVAQPISFSEMPTYHLNFYSRDPEVTTYPGASLYYIYPAHRDRVDEKEYNSKYIRRYGPDGQNDMIAMMRKEGYLNSYNHPAWSLQSYPDYAGLEGICAVEVFNSTCQCDGYDLDASDHVLQDLLKLGKRVYPVASDDIHNRREACRGWIMVKAPALEYQAFLDAYERGDFYASWGPEIHDLWIEGGVLHVDCSEVQSIAIVTERRFTARRRATEDAPLTSAEFDLKHYFDEVHRGQYDKRAFVRLVLIDQDGNKAMTRGYFADELTLAARGLSED